MMSEVIDAPLMRLPGEASLRIVGLRPKPRGLLLQAAARAAAIVLDLLGCRGPDLAPRRINGRCAKHRGDVLGRVDRRYADGQLGAL